MLLATACAAPKIQPDLSRVEGIWEYQGQSLFRMNVQRTGVVEWESRADLDHRTGHTNAVFREGKLVLAEPIHDFASGERSVYVLIHSQGREYLVAADRIRPREMEVDAFVRELWIGLRRRLPKHELRARIDEPEGDAQRDALLREWSRWPTRLSDLEWLASIASHDPDLEMRTWALYALLWAGQNEDGDVVDRAVHDAAQAAWKRVSSCADQD